MAQKTVLKKELKILNQVIDKKILRGMAYSELARRHKFIISQLLLI